MKLPKRRRALSQRGGKNPRIPVTHPSLKAADGDRYVLGFATTEAGALRHLRRYGAVKARQRLVAGVACWEPL